MNANRSERDAMIENVWRTYLTTGEFERERRQGGISDITVLGDTANTTARLASSALTGEILISDAASSASGMDFGQTERRHLELKGKSHLMSVRILTNFS